MRNDTTCKQAKEKAIIFCAVMFREAGLYNKVRDALFGKWGEPLLAGPVFDFHYTDYYRGEMGDGLKKVFLVFGRFVSPDRIYSWKRWTNRIERRLSKAGMRCVNIDPGYLTLSKLVLASTKNYFHRIYIRKDIYAEVTLRYIKDSYEGFEWTYPDYKDTPSIKFFNEARHLLTERVRESR
ncbi:MAG: DUF4416 family protein [Candidatus Omnitrophica bacterium]|nr:DUF4416 family protein [Candidatus Omnitrophota bacterium]